MRTALLTILCLMTACCSHMVPSTQKDSYVQKEFLSLIQGADELRIRDFSTDENDRIIEVDLLTIRNPRQITQWTNAIVLEDTQHCYFDYERGAEYCISNCLCAGSPILEFYRQNKQLLRFTIHHGSHIRSELINNGHDTDLTDDSSLKLKGLLQCCMDEDYFYYWQTNEKTASANK